MECSGGETGREFHLVTLVNFQVGGVLHPHVDAVGFLAGTLQGGTIEPIGGSVVLPCDVIDSFRLIN